MANSIVNHSRKLEVVRLGGIRVEDDFPVGKMLLGKRLPIFLSGRSWAREEVGDEQEPKSQACHAERGHTIAPIEGNDLL